MKPATMTDVSQVTSWFAESSHGGLYAALKNGDYERQNLKMTIEQGGPQISGVPLVAAGKQQFAMLGAADDVLLAREQGVPIVMIFGTFQINEQGLMFHNSHPVKDFPDLNGRKVYVSPATSFWVYLSKKYKLDQVQQFTYNGQLPIFLNDETAVFQCYIGEEPEAAKKAGADVGYLLNADGGYNPYGDVMVTTEQMVKEKPEVVQAYVTATIAGWKSYLENPKPILDVIKEANKDYDLDLGAKAAAVEKPLILNKGTDLKVIGTMTEQRMKDLRDQMREAGVLKTDVDYKAAFDNRFVEAAQNA
jgi:NitT/TauT family transport system substrate-binding protein